MIISKFYGIYTVLESAQKVQINYALLDVKG